MFEVTSDIRKYIDRLPVFGLESYLKTMSDKYGWCISEKFILPFVIRKKYFFRFITFTTQTIYLGDHSVKEEDFFLKEVIEYFKNKGMDFITQPPTNTIFRCVPDGSKFTNFGTYIIDLT